MQTTPAQAWEREPGWRWQIKVTFEVSPFRTLVTGRNAMNRFLRRTIHERAGGFYRRLNNLGR